MTKDERSEVLKKLAELVMAVNGIEKDQQTHDDLMHYCRKMVDIAKVK
jgi:hypothetical protein